MSSAMQCSKTFSDDTKKRKEKELGYTLLEIWIKKRLGFKGKIIKQCRAIAATISTWYHEYINL